VLPTVAVLLVAQVGVEGRQVLERPTEDRGNDLFRCVERALDESLVARVRLPTYVDVRR
jgi:hypothetical protein